MSSGREEKGSGQQPRILAFLPALIQPDSESRIGKNRRCLDNSHRIGNCNTAKEQSSLRPPVFPVDFKSQGELES